MSPFIFVILLATVYNGIILVSSQNAPSNNVVSSGLADFSIDILEKLSDELGNDYNIIISSFSIWSLMAILNSGASGTTSNQLMDVLRIPPDINVLRSGIRQIQDELLTKTRGVELNIASAIFIDQKKRLNPEFQQQVSSLYRNNIIPLDFTQPFRAVDYIDSYFANITRNKIKHFLNYDDLNNAHMLLTTGIYFKGNWNMPFNRTATFRTDFYDETLTKSIGKVMMMYQIGPYTFTKLTSLRGHVLELPYGQDERYSMLVFLPSKNIPLNTFLKQLTRTPMRSIFEDIEMAKAEFSGDDVQVYMPSFSITSDYTLNVILEKMGISNIFYPDRAELQRISRDDVYLSRVIHRATIDVNEEGTEAAAITGGTISYKSPPPVFNASHPFLYMIIESATKTVLFLGKYSNPNDNQGF